MESGQQDQPPAGGQPNESASPPPEQPSSPTPAPVEEPAPSDPSSSAPGTDTEDVAPDADEPGDDTLPEELQEHVHDGDVPPDNVDQEG